MYVAVDQPGGQVTAVEIEDIARLVGVCLRQGDPGNAASGDGHIGGDDIAGVEIEDPRVGQQQIGGLGAPGDLDQSGKVHWPVLSFLGRRFLRIPEGRLPVGERETPPLKRRCRGQHEIA